MVELASGKTATYRTEGLGRVARLKPRPLSKSTVVRPWWRVTPPGLAPPPPLIGNIPHNPSVDQKQLKIIRHRTHTHTQGDPTVFWQCSTSFTPPPHGSSCPSTFLILLETLQWRLDWTVEMWRRPSADERRRPLLHTRLHMN